MTLGEPWGNHLSRCCELINRAASCVMLHLPVKFCTGRSLMGARCTSCSLASSNGSRSVCIFCQSVVSAAGPPGGRPTCLSCADLHRWSTGRQRDRFASIVDQQQLGIAINSSTGWDSYHVIGQQPEGSYFGEHTVLLGKKRLATVVALGFCELHSLSRLSLDRMAQQWPELFDDIMSLLDGCVSICTRLVVNAYCTTAQLVAGCWS
jgi:hypothetical protein